nr:hypothetical protein Iba_chr13fCG11040 [Ipomoea batatas]
MSPHFDAGCEVSLPEFQFALRRRLRLGRTLHSHASSASLRATLRPSPPPCESATQRPSLPPCGSVSNELANDDAANKDNNSRRGLIAQGTFLTP